jgi:hypothetical protein
MFKIRDIESFLFGLFEHLDFGFVSDWSLTDASPDIRISDFLRPEPCSFLSGVAILPTMPLKGITGQMGALWV